MTAPTPMQNPWRCWHQFHFMRAAGIDFRTAAPSAPVPATNPDCVQCVLAYGHGGMHEAEIDGDLVLFH